MNREAEEKDWSRLRKFRNFRRWFSSRRWKKKTLLVWNFHVTFRQSPNKLLLSAQFDFSHFFSLESSFILFEAFSKPRDKFMVVSAKRVSAEKRKLYVCYTWFFHWHYHQRIIYQNVFNHSCCLARFLLCWFGTVVPLLSISCSFHSMFV